MPCPRGLGESTQKTEIFRVERIRSTDVALVLCPYRYASTYFELCSLVPSEEAIKNQLHQVSLPTVQTSMSTERRNAHMKKTSPAPVSGARDVT